MIEWWPASITRFYQSGWKWFEFEKVSRSLEAETGVESFGQLGAGDEDFGDPAGLAEFKVLDDAMGRVLRVLTAMKEIDSPKRQSRRADPRNKSERE
jgi:hypothetical protein